MGMLFFYADENTDAGIQHLNFKLSGNGETFSLYDRAETGVLPTRQT